MANIAKIAKLANFRAQIVPKTLSAADAKNGFADALRLAEGGELVVITRYRKPVAALLSTGRLEQLERNGSGSVEPSRADREEPRAGAKGYRPGDGGRGVEASGGAGAGEPSPVVEGEGPLGPGARTPAEEELRQRAASGVLRRIDYDLETMPKKLKPVLRLIRANLFQPRVTVERIQATLGVASHDLTTEFSRSTGASIYRYLTDRRLDCAVRLLVDTTLPVAAIARLVGYSRTEGVARAFKKRHGVRPTIFRELGGDLSLAVAKPNAVDRSPSAPRHLAGYAELPPGARCDCGTGLEPGPTVRVFEDLAPICDACARERVPELGSLLAAGRNTD